ncbi:MAG TPA: VC0807 family protein [Pseudonocardia sp.]|nr:VC0807 family protein [Pseudonocardia sp.]
MHNHHGLVIHLGTLAGQLRHAGRNLVETVVVPMGLFYLFLHLAGLNGGLLAALAWGLAAVAWRLRRRARVPAVLLLTLAMLVVRTVIGWATGSTFLYFLQPTLANFLIAGALLVSTTLKRPVLARLADDFCAFPTEFTGHPRVQRFFRRVSLLWALVFLANGAATLWVLARATLEEFLLVTTVGRAALVALAAVASLLWMRRDLRAGGILLRLRVRPAAAAA